MDEIQPSLDEIQPKMDEIQPSMDEIQPNMDEIQPTVGAESFMPLPLKSKILETPGFLVTDYIKMFPL